MSGTIVCNRPNLERLKAAVQAAERAGRDRFVFDGHDVLVAYARFLIEYLEGELGGAS